MMALLKGWPSAWLMGAALLGSGYAALLAAVWWGQERLLFHPDELPQGHRFELGPDVHETWLEVPGARLHALHLRLPQPAGVVFFLHGNAGSLQNWFVNVEFYRRANFDLFMLDYRGYGKSSGRISSQAQLQADARAAWDSLAARYTGLRRVVYGRSLGSGLAAMLAADVEPELTVLVSPYKSMAALAQQHYPWVPGGLLRYPLRTDLALARVQGPVWLVHGQLDDLIPPQHSLDLHKVSPQADLLLLPDAAHGDIHVFPAYLDAFSRVLARR